VKYSVTIFYRIEPKLENYTILLQNYKRLHFQNRTCLISIQITAQARECIQSNYRRQRCISHAAALWTIYYTSKHTIKIHQSSNAARTLSRLIYNFSRWLITLRNPIAASFLPQKPRGWVTSGKYVARGKQIFVFCLRFIFVLSEYVCNLDKWTRGLLMGESWRGVEAN
jgi:hypothetical protein